MAGRPDKEIYKRPYVRPNEKWVCGLAAEGRPCPRGPRRGGKCAGGHECNPAQVGERWVCTRPEQYGGPCDDPALPEPSFGPHVVNGTGVCCRKIHCTPERSLRARRGLLSVVLCALIAGMVLLAVGGPWRDKFLSPGPLTAAHQGASMASIEEMRHGKAGAASESCETCHAPAEGGLAGLVAAAAGKREVVPQSNQCLECHGDEIGEAALFTHALDPDRLAAQTASAKSEPFSARKPLSLALAAFSPGVKKGAGGQLACAGCHREHNGALFDLKRLDNEQCQSCHVKQFRSFDRGHPEFSTMATKAGYDYPYRRRTRIIYDHATHETDYFQREENRAHAPADCTSCHVVGDGVENTVLRPFEQVCAACHTNNIVASRDEWIHVFGFPAMEFDAYDIVEEETDASGLPRTARKAMSPFMMLLQSGLYADDPERRQQFLDDMAMVEEFSGDLSGIVFDEDPEIIARLYDGFQQIYSAAQDEEAGGLRQVAMDLLEKVRGDAVPPGRFDAMFGFPEPGDTVADIAKDLNRSDVVAESGWHAQESGYRVDGSAWKNAIGGVETYSALRAAADGDAGAYAGAVDFFSSYSDFSDWFKAHFRVDGDEFILLETGDEAENEEWEALVLAAIGGDAGTPEEDAEEDSGEGEEAAEGSDAEEDESAGEGGDALAEAGDAFVAWLTNRSKVQRWMEDEFDMTGLSWTLRAPQSLHYRPIQHADPFLTAWMDFTAGLYGRDRAAALVFDQLSGRRSGSAIGACTKCHSIDVEENLASEKLVKVNWKSAKDERPFTKFNHSPHLKLMDCAQCHRAPWIPSIQERTQMARAASAEEEAVAAETDDAAADESADTAPDITYADSFKAAPGELELGVDFSNRDHAPGEFAFASNFNPVTKADCARCHVPGKAGDSCLICHNYHIQSTNWSAGVKSLSELLAAAIQAEEAPAEPEEAAAPEEAVAPAE